MPSAHPAADVDQGLVVLAGGDGDAVQVDVHVDDVLRQHHGHDHQCQQANL